MNLAMTALEILRRAATAEKSGPLLRAVHRLQRPFSKPHRSPELPGHASGKPPPADRVDEPTRGRPRTGQSFWGRHRKVASPQSITLGRWLWVPDPPRPILGLREIGIIRCAHR